MDIKAILGDTLLSKDGEVSTDSVFQEGTIVGIYFSAHWCPPCRGFTPKLAEFYKKMEEKGKAFKVIFVSSDQDEEAFNEYYASMPWLALPFPRREAEKKLSTIYEIAGIPTLHLLDGGSGEIIKKEADEDLGEDSEGKNFPWN